MAIVLTQKERKIERAIARLKKGSGSHSPAPAELLEEGIAVKHDFCYLSNPHATELFLRFFRKDFKNTRKIRAVVEHYPSQNRALAKKVRHIANVPACHIFVGNGATEIIQAVLSCFSERKILVPIPTFSPYLEFAPKGVRVVYHQLSKTRGFCLDEGDFLAQVKQEKPDTVVLINPNNPDGGHLSLMRLRSIILRLHFVPTIIVDESFSHFAGRTIESATALVKTNPNLVVIKSLSKDFGIAGLRLGYAVMSKKRVAALLERGYLWNVSGFGEYFLDLLNRPSFLREYGKARRRALRERDGLFRGLAEICALKTYPSKGNFFLVAFKDGSKANNLVAALLARHGIYVRSCGDKTGLRGEFVRVASRTKEENNFLVLALRELFP